MNHQRLRRLGRIGLLAAAASLLPIGALAVPVVYTVGTGGLDAGFGCTTNPACLSGTGTSFTYAPPGAGYDPAGGTITLDDSALTLAVNLSVSSATFLDTTAPFNGIDEVEFTNMSYAGTLNLTAAGPGLWNVTGGQSVTVAGTAEQKLAGGTVVGPAAFGGTATVSSGQCALVAGFLTCGFDIGPGPAGGGMTIGIGAPPTAQRFVHTLNVTAIPEPGTAILLGVGVLGLAARRRS